MFIFSQLQGYNGLPKFHMGHLASFYILKIMHGAEGIILNLEQTF